MQSWVEFVGPERVLQVFGVRLLGVTAETGRKLLLSVGVVVVLTLVGGGIRALVRPLGSRRGDPRPRFWAQQATRIATTTVGLLALISIWFDDPARLGTVVGLVSAGLAIALQRVVTAAAAYFVILRGRLFAVGDRIVMGGVRGDVIALGFIRTTIMEMGQPPPVQSDEPAVWVAARQYTGRVVTITNDKIFDLPVYNYTREFPYIWEELHLPIPYSGDRARAEQILLAAAERHSTRTAELGAEALGELRRRYFLAEADVRPRVYWQLTDNWLELSVRFLAPEHGVREIKDAMSREILEAFDAAGIQVASATYEIVGLPPIRIDGGRAGVPSPGG